MEKYDINSSEHANRDPYAVEGDALTFPERLIELYLSDLLEEHDIAYTVRKGRARVRINPAGQLKSRSGEFTTLTKDDLRQAQIEAFYANVWYPELPADVTFLSLLFDLSRADIDELDNAAQQRVTLTSTSVYKRFDQFVQANLAKLGGSFFVKLNSVSPKDVVASGKELRFTNAEGALLLLLKSGRTLGTLRQRRLPIAIMLREWCDLPEPMEFRCFIHRNRLRAVSQYQCYTFYPQLQDRALQASIVARITQFYGATFMAVPYEDCVMDVVVWDERKAKSFKQLGIFVVEFNAFGAELPTGAALFNWDRDYDILYNAQTPQMRVVTEPSIEQKLNELQVAEAKAQASK